MSHLIETIKMLEKDGIGFKSITENIDTTSAVGRLIFHLFGALAEFERDLIWGSDINVTKNNAKGVLRAGL